MTEAWGAVLETPLPGWHLGVRCRGAAVVAIEWLAVGQAPASAPLDPACRPLADAVAGYFRGEPWPALPLEPAGTPFQRRVWRALQGIPPGQTRTYGALARELGSAPRALAGACRANPLPLVIPCHRVLAANGLGGYMGATAGPELEIKRWLLRHEGAV